MKRSMRDILQAAADPFEDTFDPALRQEMVSRSEALPVPDLSAGDPDATSAVPSPSDASQTPAAELSAQPSVPAVSSSGTPNHGAPANQVPPVFPASAGVLPAMDPRLAATPAGQSLAAAAIVPERITARQISDFLRLRRSMEGLITRGDPPPKAKSLSATDQAQALRDLGIPDRPQTWPVFMAWPPQVVLNRFLSPGVTPEQRADMIRALSRVNDAMLARSRQIKPWFDLHNPIQDQDRKSLRSVGRDSADPHYGVKWGMLLNPGPQDHAVLSTVVCWGHCLAVTADGGAVRASNDSLSFERSGLAPVGITPQSVSLAIFEARNRGWGRLRMQGSYEFGMMAIKAARDAGVDAEITYSGRGLMSWKTYRVKVTPGLPAPQPMPDDPDTSPAAARPVAGAGASPRSAPAFPATPVIDPVPGGHRALRGVIPNIPKDRDDPSNPVAGPSP